MSDEHEDSVESTIDCALGFDDGFMLGLQVGVMASLAPERESVVGCLDCECDPEDAAPQKTGELPMAVQRDIRQALEARGVVDPDDEILSKVVVCPKQTVAYTRSV